MADRTEHGDQHLRQPSAESTPPGVSRRGLIIGGGAAVAATALGVAAASQASAESNGEVVHDTGVLRHRGHG